MADAGEQLTILQEAFKDRQYNIIEKARGDKTIITYHSTPEDVAKWLHEGHFEKEVAAFRGYTGAQMFAQTKEQIRQKTDVAGAMRLFRLLDTLRDQANIPVAVVSGLIC
jgi:hypothetical protein